MGAMKKIKKNRDGAVQFIYLCLKHPYTYIQLIIKMQRRPAIGLLQAASMQATF